MSATFIKFGMVDAFGVIVNLSAFSALLGFGVGKYASPVAIEISIISNFLLNNYWTFRRRSTKDKLRTKGLKFNIVSIGTLVISYGTFVTLSLTYADIDSRML